MNRIQKLLTLLILAELVGGLLLAASHITSRPLPRANMSRLHADTAEDLRSLEAQVDVDEPADWLMLADAYRQFGLLVEADYSYRQAHELKPDDGDGLMRWAYTSSRRGRIDESIRRFEQAKAVDPSFAPRCNAYLALVRLRTVSAEAAEQALRRAAEVPWVRITLVRRLIRTDRASEAAELLDELLKSYPRDLHVNQLRARAAAELGQWPQATAYEARSLRGSVELRSYDAVRAMDAKRRPLSELGRLSQQSLDLESQGDVEGALRAARAAAKLRPSAMTDERVAYLELRFGRAKTAVKRLRESSRKFGADAQFLKLLGDAYAIDGQHQQARTVWLQAVDTRADEETHRRLADSYRQAEDLPQAKRHEGLASYERGKQAWLQNDLKTARQHFLAASELLADHAHTWFYLADTLRALGDEAAAQRAYDRCLAINPNHGRARRALTQPPAE